MQNTMRPALTLDRLAAWLDRYFAAWQSNDPGDVAPLFAEDAVYFYGPFEAPAVGREEIVRRWVADPEQQRDIHLSYTPLAVNGPLGIAHWQASFRPALDSSARVEIDGILVLTFDADGRCSEHREWYVRQERP